MGVDFADIDRDGHLDFFVADMWSRDPRIRKRQKPAQNPMASLPGVIDDRPQFMRNTLFHNRGDGTFEPNFQGVIETTDGATILLDSKGYGSASLAGERQVVVSGTHVSDHEKYIWLNNTIAVGEGAVHTLSSGEMEFVFSWYELVWEPITQ